MSILLINPPRSLDDKNIWKGVNSCTLPFGLAIIAAVLELNGIKCDILDCEAERLDLPGILSRVREGEYSYVGITATTVMIETALEIARNIKKNIPAIKIVLGGVHATVYYEQLFSEDCVDFIIRREAETPLVKLLSGEKHHKIENLSYRNGTEVMHNPDAKVLYDISEQPLLAYDKLPMGKYYSALGSYKRKPSIGMITSRGCPGKCTFCFSDFLGNRTRFMPAERIIREIKFLMQNYGIREISFYDDTFTSNPNNVKRLCNIMINEKIDLTWSCFSRVDTVSSDLLISMKKAGCHQIMFGLESASPQILKNINKKVDFDKNAEAVKLSKKAGIDVRAAFMIGNPGETEDTIKQTIRYAIELNPDLVIFNITTPYPGTKMFKWAKESGFLITEKWSDYDLAKPVMRLPTIDNKTIEMYYKRAYRQFYFRPKYIIGKLIKMRDPEEIFVNFKAFMSILGLK